MTNITELAYCLPSSIAPKTPTKISGVHSLLPGETVEQAIKRRAENHKRIQEKMKHRK